MALLEAFSAARAPIPRLHVQATSPTAKNKLFPIGVFLVNFFMKYIYWPRPLEIFCFRVWKLHRLKPVKQGAAEKGFCGRVAGLEDSSCMAAALLPAPYWFRVLQG